MDNGVSPQFSSFSGPLTLVEIKKALSIKKPTYMIQRRSTISDMMPSRNIYADIPELDICHKMTLVNHSDDELDSSFEEQCLGYAALKETSDKEFVAPLSNYVPQMSETSALAHYEDMQKDNKNEIRKLFTDTVIVISDDEDSYSNLDLSTNLSKSSSHLNLDEDNDFSNSADNGTESVKFNDTLEEMESFLKQGLNYVTNTETDRKTPNQSTDSFKKPTSKIPVNAKRNIRKNTPTLQKVINFNDVVSPVAIYIKNLPHVPQIQNVTPKVLSQRNLFPTKSFPNNRALDKPVELPHVIYAPPRMIVKTTESSVKLPTNIQRHLPRTPHIIKHVGRAKENVKSDLEKKLLICDLSTNNLDLDNTVPLQEISVHNCKDIFMLPSKR